MVQPAVSIAIKELEKYYGIQLFDRISRHIYPTEHGKRFYQYALHIVSLFDEMETQIKDWDNLGEFRVGSSITIGTSFLPLKIREFHRLYPSIKVSAHIKKTVRPLSSISLTINWISRSLRDLSQILRLSSSLSFPTISV